LPEASLDVFIFAKLRKIVEIKAIIAEKMQRKLKINELF